MDIQTVVKSALGGLSVPVFLGTWEGASVAPSQYITFTTRHYRALYADDEATEDEYIVFIEIWSDTNYLALKNLVITAMESAGFNLTDEQDVIDPDTKHLSQTWYGVV